MTQRTLEMGIRAIQQGSAEEGARLLRIALKGGALVGELRAIAYLWLAETTPDAAQKRQYISAAVSADPNNTDARARLATMLAPPSPTATASIPTPAQVMNPSPVNNAPVTGVNIADYVARVIGGANGPGTAFFITEDLLATARYVVGALDRVTLELYSGGQLPGEIVRAFPELDIALIRLRGTYRPPATLPITPLPRVPDDAPLYVVPFTGEIAPGHQRPTKRAMAAHWIPTSFMTLTDAGGAPIFDERSYLVGMITRNHSRASSHLYGIHINAIRRCLDVYTRDMISGERRMYCPQCGTGSRAGGAGYFFCEICGSTLPHALHVPRTPTPQAEPYYALPTTPCTRCGAAVGFHGGRCLRCGQTAEYRS